MKPSTKKKLWKALGITAGAAALFGAGKYCYDRGREDGEKVGAKREAEELTKKLYDLTGYKSEYKHYAWPENLLAQCAYVNHDEDSTKEAHKGLGNNVVFRIIAIGDGDGKMRDTKTIREDEKAKNFDYITIDDCGVIEETETTEKTEETEKTNWEE